MGCRLGGLPLELQEFANNKTTDDILKLIEEKQKELNIK